MEANIYDRTLKDSLGKLEVASGSRFGAITTSVSQGEQQQQHGKEAMFHDHAKLAA
jgi:hypothetical protein